MSLLDKIKDYGLEDLQNFFQAINNNTELTISDVNVGKPKRGNGVGVALENKENENDKLWAKYVTDFRWVDVYNFTHKHIAEFVVQIHVGPYQSDNDAYFISEYCDAGDLCAEAKSEMSKPDRLSQALSHFTSFSFMLKTLGDLGVAHTDIKLSNFLANNKISDFKGLCLFGNNPIKLFSKDFDSTAGFLPYEVRESMQMLPGQKYTGISIENRQTNVVQLQSFQFGLAIYSYLTGEYLEGLASDNIDFKFEFDNKIFNSEQGQQFKYLIEQLTHKDPEQRISMTKATNLLSMMNHYQSVTETINEARNIISNQDTSHDDKNAFTDMLGNKNTQGLVKQQQRLHNLCSGREGLNAVTPERFRAEQNYTLGCLEDANARLEAKQPELKGQDSFIGRAINKIKQFGRRCKAIWNFGREQAAELAHYDFKGRLKSAEDMTSTQKLISNWAKNGLVKVARHMPGCELDKQSSPHKVVSKAIDSLAEKGRSVLSIF